MASKNEESKPGGFFGSVKRMGKNLGHQTKIQSYEHKVAQRQKQFGVDYLTLVEDGASERELKKCVKEAMADIATLRDKIDIRHDKIEANKNPPSKPEAAPTRDESDSNGEDDSDRKEQARAAKPRKQERRAKPDPEKEKEQAPAVKPQKEKSKDTKSSSPKAEKKKNKDTKTDSSKAEKKKNNKSTDTSDSSQEKTTSPAGVVTGEYDPSKWRTKEMKFDGSAKYTSKGKEKKVKGVPIEKGIEKFKANPDKYAVMIYQNDMVNWPAEQIQFTYVYRNGTKAYQPKGVSPKGWMTVILHEYERLPPLKDNLLPSEHRDKWTDKMTFQGHKLHSKKHKPILPGRGMGCVDAPELKIIGDVDPSDIHQGMVGDCWLLSGISALAEFDGAVKRLFRKTKNLDKMPFDDRPNLYTITLWDLETWKEVDIVIDERLCAAPEGSGLLLGANPSEDGELWVCYLEKAMAIHAGGWDHLVGGQCTHAWALMTGCKKQYTIRLNKKTGKYGCFSRYNTKAKKWAKHGNAPRDGEQGTWRCPWPEVGGGGEAGLELTEEELFDRMVAWDETNYIVGAGASSDGKGKADAGLVDDHAYTVIESRKHVAGTRKNLIKVRNPWGSGEIEDGEFDDDGPGWDKYPQIKKELKPVVADDGIFWVTDKEFFRFYQTIYLSASDMTEFLED